MLGIFAKATQTQMVFSTLLAILVVFVILKVLNFFRDRRMFSMTGGFNPQQLRQVPQHSHRRFN